MCRCLLKITLKKHPIRDKLLVLNYLLHVPGQFPAKKVNGDDGGPEL